LAAERGAPVRERRRLRVEMCHVANNEFIVVRLDDLVVKVRPDDPEAISMVWVEGSWYPAVLTTREVMESDDVQLLFEADLVDLGIGDLGVVE
jgi:hypothetical protein